MLLSLIHKEFYLFAYSRFLMSAQVINLMNAKTELEKYAADLSAQLSEAKSLEKGLHDSLRYIGCYHEDVLP